MGRVFNSIDASYATQLFEQIKHASKTGADIGVTRPSYSAVESFVLDLLAETAYEAGLVTLRDEAENLHVTLPDAPAHSAVWIGSHVDSVPQGGNYDGLAGVIAGLLCLRKLKEREIAPPRPVTTVALRGEESAWFGIPYIGSKALFGKLTKDDLARRFQGHGSSLRDRMQLQGAKIARIETQDVLVPPMYIAEFWELHIEQGPVLVERNLPIGVVKNIRGNVRHSDIQIMGVAGHSGTTPRELRHDAVFAFAAFISLLDASWSVFARRRDLVVTCGVVSTDATVHGITRIPENVKFCLEWRSHEAEVLDLFADVVEKVRQDVERTHGVSFVFDKAVKTLPAALSETLGMRATQACEELGLSTMSMPSGAGHDAAIFAAQGIPTGMIFVRNEHGSHNPREAMDMDDFMAAVEVLYKVVTRVKDYSW